MNNRHRSFDQTRKFDRIQRSKSLIICIYMHRAIINNEQIYLLMLAPRIILVYGLNAK